MNLAVHHLRWRGLLQLFEAHAFCPHRMPMSLKPAAGDETPPSPSPRRKRSLWGGFGEVFRGPSS